MDVRFLCSILRCKPVPILIIICSQQYAVAQVGINISSPQAMLHVRAESSGATASSLATAVFESNNHMGINLLTPNNFESGIFFGNAIHSAHGAIVYNSTTLYGLSFRTNGNINRMVITDIGNVGIGTTAPSDRLHINSTGDPLAFRSIVRRSSVYLQTVARVSARTSLHL